jgi:succinate-acetate transporter protein
MSNETPPKIANPAPLGLLGFGLTTVLLNLANAGAFPLDSMILGMGIAYGGLMQLFAGTMEYKNGNTFGTVAFMSYGGFWFSLILLLILPGTLGVAGPSTNSMVAYFAMWGFFTALMFVGTLPANRGIQVVFLTLTILFFMLAASEYTGNLDLKHVTGYEGIICGLSAFYLAIAEVLNEVHKKTILPIFPVAAAIPAAGKEEKADKADK